MQDLLLPPSITLKPTSVGVAVLTVGGISVEVNLPRPRSLHELPGPVIAAQARRLAREALMNAAQTLND
jgi:hypothetical protein